MCKARYLVAYQVLDVLYAVRCNLVHGGTPYEDDNSIAVVENALSLLQMADSLINFLSSAAEKMRRQRLTTNAISVFIETNLFKEKGVYTNSATLKIQPTDSTLELIPPALRILQAIYKPGYGYRKSGVLLLGLTPIEGETKRLFCDEDYQADRELMRTVDALNQKYGRYTVRFGMPVKRMKSWHMSRNHLSAAFTTDIEQVMRIAI